MPIHKTQAEKIVGSVVVFTQFAEMGVPLTMFNTTVELQYGKVIDIIITEDGSRRLLVVLLEGYDDVGVMHYGNHAVLVRPYDARVCLDDGTIARDLLV